MAESDNDQNETNLVNAGALEVTIWAFILWFEDLNLALFKESYYSLFILMQIRVYFTLVIYGIGCAVLVFSIIFICVQCCRYI